MIMSGFEPATQPRFTLGHTYATTTITRWANKHGIDLTDYLHRHHCGDWGDLEDEDLQANETALETGARILSCYWLGETKIYIITEADRSTTTILLAIEY